MSTKKLPFTRQILSGDYDREICEAMARAMFVTDWADRMEEKGKRFPPRTELMDAAPKTSRDALQAARALSAEIIKLNNVKSLTDLLARALNAGGHGSASTFGHYLAMQAMGHGVSWYDDGNPEFGLKLPYFEYYSGRGRVAQKLGRAIPPHHGKPVKPGDLAFQPWAPGWELSPNQHAYKKVDEKWKLLASGTINEKIAKASEWTGDAIIGGIRMRVFRSGRSRYAQRTGRLRAKVSKDRAGGAAGRARGDDKSPREVHRLGGGKIQVNERMWQHFLGEARRSKREALKRSADPSWMKSASGVSIEWVNEALQKPVEQVAAEHLAYIEMRARRVGLGGYPVNKPEYDLWKKLGGTIAGHASDHAKPRGKADHCGCEKAK